MLRRPSWTLSQDCTEVRLSLPPIALEGLPKPLELFVDFDAKAVDQILARLSVLRVKMRAIANDDGRPS